MLVLVAVLKAGEHAQGDVEGFEGLEGCDRQRLRPWGGLGVAGGAALGHGGRSMEQRRRQVVANDRKKIWVWKGCKIPDDV